MSQTPQHNLDCTDVKALLSALVDDEVDETTRHGAERHLAGCAPCRALLDEAESVDQMMRDDFTRRSSDGLPMGFEQSVISLLRDDHRISAYWRHWTTWTGWIAAAACLALAVTMWVTQDRVARSFDNAVTGAGATGPDLDNPDAFLAASHTNGVRHRSWTSPVDFPAEVEVYGPPAPADLASRQASLAHRVTVDPFYVDPDIAAVRANRSFSDPADERAHGDDARSEHSPQTNENARTSLGDDDRSAIYLASIVLDIVEHADLSTSMDIDEAREIIEYDGLIERLAQCHERLAAADRARVLAAEAVLQRIANGPLDRTDVEQLQRTIAEQNLTGALDKLSERPRSAPAI